MNCDYVKDYEFVAIFDADFQPNLDFLKQTVPHFKVSETHFTTTKNVYYNKKKKIVAITMKSLQ